MYLIACSYGQRNGDNGGMEITENTADAPLDTPDERWMRVALGAAERAAAAGEVPVGAVLVRHGEVLAAAGNAPIGLHDPTAHAEVLAIRAAAVQLADYRLGGTTLYVTLEPCAMCAAAMLHARVERVVFGAWDPRVGAVGSRLNLFQMPGQNHRIDFIGGVLAAECSAVLRRFFAAKRAGSNPA
jgi:tRNA(adenine34) deaminase